MCCFLTKKINALLEHTVVAWLKITVEFKPHPLKVIAVVDSVCYQLMNFPHYYSDMWGYNIPSDTVTLLADGRAVQSQLLLLLLTLLLW